MQATRMEPLTGTTKRELLVELHHAKDEAKLLERMERRAAQLKGETIARVKIKPSKISKKRLRHAKRHARK